MTRRRLVVAGVSFALVVGGVFGVLHRLRTLPEDAVLRYDGTIVTTAELDRRIAVLKAVYGVEPPTRGAARAQFNRDAAKSYAVSLVLADVAASRGIKVAESAASRELSTMVDQKLGGDDDAFLDFLTRAGVNRADIVAEVRQAIAARRLYAEVTRGVAQATTADARRVYTAQEARMTSPEQRTLRTIVVPSKTEAVRIRQQLDDGVDFATLAREASEDGISRSDGGLLGTLPRSALEPGFADPAFRAKEGATFGPVRGQHGWNVGRVDDILPPRPVAFAEAKDALVRQLTAKRLAAVWNPWLYRQLRKADVEYAAAYRPRNPYAPGPDLSTVLSDSRTR